LIDLADVEKDTIKTEPIYDKFDAVFVVHWFDNIHKKYNNVFPLCPVNFTNWALFEKLRKNINFLPDKDKLILNNQRPMGDRWRRQKAQTLIKKHYPNQNDTKYYSGNQENFFMNLNKALVSVHVPGCREDILDRGQTQMFGLGACTISPYMKEKLAWNVKVEAWTHYVPCQPDMSDLVEKINWCMERPQMCKEIGENAKKLFDDNIHPTKLKEWFEKCLTL
jgi:hypothetical protein